MNKRRPHPVAMLLVIIVMAWASGAAQAGQVAAAVDTVKATAVTAGHAARDAALQVGHGARTAAREVADTAVEVGHAVRDGAVQTGQTVKRYATQAGEAIKPSGTSGQRAPVVDATPTLPAPQQAKP